MTRIKPLIYLLLLAGLTASTCRNQPGAPEAKDQQENPVLEKNRSEITVDSADIQLYLGKWADVREFGADMKTLYRERGFQTIWWDGRSFKSHAEKLIARLKNAEYEGLDPDHYKGQELETMFAEVQKSRNPEDIAHTDVFLTAEFYKYAANLYAGSTRRTAGDASWYVVKSDVPYDSLLALVLHNNDDDPYIIVAPPHPEYRKLKEHLARHIDYRHKVKWPRLEGANKLKLGDTGQAVRQLRERLIITNDFTTIASSVYNPMVFDESLEQAVKMFQTRHGLEPDGKVGERTLANLNRSLEERINQIKVNMERWRLLPHHLGDRFIKVNVPEFRLRVFEKDAQKFDMRVIVGKEFTATPAFADEVEHIVFSPYWNIPKSIIKGEILPLIYRDGSYLDRNNMEAMQGFGRDARVVNFWQVPWSNIDEPGFQYWIRQRPGPDNPLGLVKFLFPNQYNIYLHDTPSKRLFSTYSRTYSHGCIRIEKPIALAKYLLADKPEWTEQSILEAMDRGSEQWVNITPLPVYILYLTTWVDDDGILNFRDDIYNQDGRMMQQMGLKT